MSQPVRKTVRRAESGRIAFEAVEVPQATIDSLRDALAAQLEGEVRFSAGDRALYATDASNYRQVPYGAVIPKSAEDVVTTIRLCAERDVPVTPRGGGTALAGQTCNAAVIIDFSKYLNRIVSLDPEKRLAVVEPGCVLDHLREAAERHGLTFGPDPSTHDHNTLGGMIGNNSCGSHSVMAGRTADNVQALDVVCYDGLRLTVGPTTAAEFQAIVAAGGRRGEIYRRLADFWKQHGHHFLQVYPDIPRRVSGYENLDQLSPEKGFNVARALTGTEATCAIVLNATVNLVPSPPARVLCLIGFDDIFQAADAVPDVLETGPIALEAIDHLLTEYMKRKHFRVGELEILPAGCAWLIAEFGSDKTDDACHSANRLLERMRSKGHSGRLVTDRAKQMEVWEVREAALAVTAHVPGQGDTWPGWEDSAVRRDDLGGYLRELKALFHKHGYEASVYGHFGDGLVHCRVNFDLRSEAGLANWQRFLEEAADLVVKYGGSLSGEHGDGQARAQLLERMYGPDLMAAQRSFRAIWDPRQRMNPGKVIDPYPVTSNLRVGPSYRPAQIRALYEYPEDGADFTKATLRCVGVGKCRRREPKRGVMCPSYLATGEEKHSTRGRARLLFEMLRGDALPDGFGNLEVEEALNLCLACKGCKHDCPVQVDMASYKAEFRARHYANRLRPRAAYSMGQIARWARLAGIAPGLANAALGTPGISGAIKWIGGIAKPRRMPAFASPSYRQWHVRRAPTGGQRVIMWPDTFNNFFRAETAIAATRLLERLGFRVDIPSRPLCCGRPLYDWGWIEQAKALWRRTLNVLRADVEAGTIIVGLEPACVSAFRDELPALFPGDPLALALSRQTHLLSEFLDGRQFDSTALDIPKSAGVAQLHCHHHAVLGEEPERKLLSALDIDILREGCCGMAGAFGFEAEKYDLSLRIGELGVLPKIRATAPGAPILANGFSCREQIEQATGRKTLHLAEFLAQALPKEQARR